MRECELVAVRVAVASVMAVGVARSVAGRIAAVMAAVSALVIAAEFNFTTYTEVRNEAFIIFPGIAKVSEELVAVCFCFCRADIKIIL